MRNFFSTLLSVTILFTSCSPKLAPESYDPEGSTDTRDKTVAFQEKKTWTIPQTGLRASNEFAGARLNLFSRVNDSVYVATILAENTPVNKSPWYAFSLRSDDPAQITVILKYQEPYTHRYYPDISHDMTSWSPLDSSRFSVDTLQHTASLTLDVGPEIVYVAAQEVFSSQSTYAYFRELAADGAVSLTEIGRSRQDKPLMLLQTGDPASKKAIVVIGRQHPPETTGFLAFRGFAERLLENDSLGREFRRKYDILMIPMLNPDGIDNGHWRHNAAGIDLNRDWHAFNQPETRAVRDYLVRYARENEKEILFAIDFHSTQEDLFYVFDREKPSRLTGFTHEWLDELENILGDYKADRIPTSGNSPVSTRWFHEAFYTEAVTYEVGDDSSRERIHEIGRAAALAMMRLLND